MPMQRAHPPPMPKRSTRLASIGHEIPVWKSHCTWVQKWWAGSWVSKLQLVSALSSQAESFRKRTRGNVGGNTLPLSCDRTCGNRPVGFLTTAGEYRPFWHIVITPTGELVG